MSILATQSIYSPARLAILPPKTKFLQERGSISGLEANHTMTYLYPFFWRLSLLCSVVKCQNHSFQQLDGEVDMTEDSGCQRYQPHFNFGRAKIGHLHTTSMRIVAGGANLTSAFQ